MKSLHVEPNDAKNRVATLIRDLLEDKFKFIHIGGTEEKPNTTMQRYDQKYENCARMLTSEARRNWATVNMVVSKLKQPIVLTSATGNNEPRAVLIPFSNDPISAPLTRVLDSIGAQYGSKFENKDNQTLVDIEKRLFLLESVVINLMKNNK